MNDSHEVLSWGFEVLNVYPSPDPVVSVGSPPWQPGTGKAYYPKCLGIRATAFLYKVQKATAKRIRRYFDGSSASTLQR